MKKEIKRLLTYYFQTFKIENPNHTIIESEKNPKEVVFTQQEKDELARLQQIVQSSGVQKNEKPVSSDSQTVELHKPPIIKSDTSSGEGKGRLMAAIEKGAEKEREKTDAVFATFLQKINENIKK